MSAFGGGAYPGMSVAGPGVGATGTVRAPGGPGASGAAGTPATFGDNSPGKAALGTPGPPTAAGFGDEIAMSAPGYAGPPNGP